MVLALSQSESVQKKLLEEQLMSQEEEDLARALAASMLSTESNFPSSDTPELLDTHTIQSSPYHMPLTSPPNNLPGVTPGGPAEKSSGASIQHDAEFGRYNKWRIPNYTETQQGEEAPKIEAQANVVRDKSPDLSSASSLPYDPPLSLRPAVKRSSLSCPSSSPRNIPEWGYSELLKYAQPDGAQEISFPEQFTAAGADLSFNMVSPETVLEFDDAAYARQLASDEEKLLKQLNQSLHSKESQSDYFADQAKSSSTSYGKQNVEWDRAQSSKAILEEPYGRQLPQDPQASISGATASVPVSPSTSVVQSTHSPTPDYSPPPMGRVNSCQPDMQSERKSPIQLPIVAYPSLEGRRGSAPDIHFESSPNSSPPPPHNDRSHLRLDLPQPLATPGTRL